MTAFFGVPNGSWNWIGIEPGIYKSSSHATRYFCSNCGTPMAYESTKFPDEMHFYAAALTDPDSVRPTEHYHYQEKLAWLHLSDDLPKHSGSSASD
ncbi:MAG: GFA family protein [Gammaproteobacteria bacterium]|nr:GFA family protein [Gammaproteobacteria bacterium]